MKTHSLTMQTTLFFFCFFSKCTYHKTEIPFNVTKMKKNQQNNYKKKQEQFNCFQQAMYRFDSSTTLDLMEGSPVRLVKCIAGVG